MDIYIYIYIYIPGLCKLFVSHTIEVPDAGEFLFFKQRGLTVSFILGREIARFRCMHCPLLLETRYAAVKRQKKSI